MPLYFFASRCFSIFQRNYGFALLPLTPLMCFSTAFLRFFRESNGCLWPLSLTLQLCPLSLDWIAKEQKILLTKSRKRESGETVSLHTIKRKHNHVSIQMSPIFYKLFARTKELLSTQNVKGSLPVRKMWKNTDIVSTCGRINPSSKSY